jgi:hypothetical protein
LFEVSIMDLALVKKVLLNWHSGTGYKIKNCPPESKFITGYPSTDAQLHQFQVDSGCEITLSKNWTSIEKCLVLDEEKFLMFVLKWS